ncbi:hypothetical protein [Pseudorhodoplanes sinuspersici]|uniref:Outer membrane protein beta-barrel domain-containing protein n=1 Tax=Pseudorhodoplanes sinuspersici TaxID=1235591 RepID=A0A1W6ZPX2_9HYPH|nr:hypothetical protein [Pseudorhodoplanes sinuspersici]ARP99335.1 hypothetical protein CAK95_09745 [Pseudorhodoplanes sinuspersici]
MRKAAAIATIAVLFGLSAIPAQAASKKQATGTNESNSVPEVPSDDIFGFTSPTDVGDVGDLGFANENDGRTGKRDGRYRALDSKFEFSSTPARDWWMAGSFFAAWDRIRNVTDLHANSTSSFDGISFEIERLLVRRSAGNPFAVSLSVEPRWSRIDPVSGLRSTAYNAQFKIFVDAVVIPEKLYWAANVYFTPQRAQNIIDRSIQLDSSSTFLSTALTFQLSPSLFVGAEARHLTSYNGLWLNERMGYAFYVGPTMAWKITDKIVFNTTWQPQISGRSAINPGLRYDLDNFERTQFRVKLSLGLN